MRKGAPCALYFAVDFLLLTLLLVRVLLLLPEEPLALVLFRLEADRPVVER